MRQRFTTSIRYCYDFLAKPTFFIAGLILFIFESLWLALSSNLLPYDEYYHLIIIKFYSHQWSPFVSQQPDSLKFVGDVTRLPSYLYHYLMSFPYRFFDLFLHSEMQKVILLRCINIAMVAAGIILFRKLFQNIGISKRLSNVVCVLFMFIPLVSLLAAENNYDNLMFLLTPLFLLFCWRLIKGQITIFNLVMVIVISCVTSLVKYNFLPIACIGLLLTAVMILSSHRKEFCASLKHNFKHTSKLKVFALIVVLLVSLGFFVERYGTNIIRYHQIDIDCSAVQSDDVCWNYSPWRRNQIAKNTQAGQGQWAYQNPLSYGVHWVTTIAGGYSAIFANIIQDPSTTDPYGVYAFKSSLIPLQVATYGFLSVGLLAVVLKMKYLWKNEYLRFLLLLSVGYTVVLLLFNYHAYLELGYPYAIQARYLVPLLLPMLMLIISALRLLKIPKKLPQVCLPLLIVIYICNGGVVGWVLRADTNWYWPNRSVQSANKVAKSVLSRVIIH